MDASAAERRSCAELHAAPEHVAVPEHPHCCEPFVRTARSALRFTLTAKVLNFGSEEIVYATFSLATQSRAGSRVIATIPPAIDSYGDSIVCYVLSVVSQDAPSFNLSRVAAVSAGTMRNIPASSD